MAIIFNIAPDGRSANEETTPGTVHSAEKRFSPNNFLQKRSKAYLSCFQGLDAETLTATSGWAAALEQIKDEFGTADIAGYPLGIVSKCYLGHPFEVHIMDLTGTQIIQHYRVNEVMPENFEKARSLAKNDHYSLIEIYTDKIIVVRPDGSVTKI